MVFLVLLVLVLLHVRMYVCSTMTTRQSSTIQHPTVSVNRLCEWKLQSSMLLLLLLSSIDNLWWSYNMHQEQQTLVAQILVATMVMVVMMIWQNAKCSSLFLRISIIHQPCWGTAATILYMGLFQELKICLASVEKFSFKRHCLYWGCCIQQFFKLGLHFLKNVHGNNTNP
jgi:hypothetical protein